MKRLIAILSLMLLLSVRAEAAQRPNFIFVLIDDMGYGDMFVYGNTAVQTENLAGK